MTETQIKEKLAYLKQKRKNILDTLEALKTKTAQEKNTLKSIEKEIEQYEQNTSNH